MLVYENKYKILYIKGDNITKKRVLVLGMALATLLCGCGKEVKTVETETVVETEIEYEIGERETDEFGRTSVRADIMGTLYPIVEEIIGEELIDQDVRCDDNGIYVDERFISYEYIDEFSYNSKRNNF